jgi:hypothetical protein
MGLVRADLLPDHFGDGDADGIPETTVLVLGTVTAAFTAAGSLGAITSFASLAFIVVFGAMSALAFRHRDHGAIHPGPPAIGTAGAFLFAPVMLWNLFEREPGTFWTVLVVAAAVVGVELLYFERERLPDPLLDVGAEVEDDVTALADGVEGLAPGALSGDESDGGDG